MLVNTPLPPSTLLPVCCLLLLPLRAQPLEGTAAQIDTVVDTAYIYDYGQTKFVPPDGKTLLIMGQTVERINEYRDSFPNQTLPGGWAAYWGVTEFKGIAEAHRNETGGTQHHQMLVDQFPNTAIQSAMWMVGRWDIAKQASRGAYDEVIRQYAAWAKAAKRPIYLRIGYEFDGPHNALKPKHYVRAYRRIVDLLRAEGADNIAFVWHSYAAEPYRNHALSDWYPGDDYVDWVGVSVFDHAYRGSDFGPYTDAVLDFAREHRKPTMIAEASPIHGIDAERDEVWEEWFVHFFTFIYRKNIRAISFITENWDDVRIPEISHWGDARLANNTRVAAAWFREVSKDRYLKQSEGLYELLGYLEEE